MIKILQDIINMINYLKVIRYQKTNNLLTKILILKTKRLSKKNKKLFRLGRI